MSPSPKLIILDQLAAKFAQELVAQCAANIENSVTKGLGVLQENGVYACFLYFLAKEKEIGKIAVQNMLNLLHDLPFGWITPASNSAPADILKFVAETVTSDLEKLLLTKETLEQMLIYARYGAKAKED